jgi:hypothetical protein
MCDALNIMKSHANFSPHFFVTGAAKAGAMAVYPRYLGRFRSLTRTKHAQRVRPIVIVIIVKDEPTLVGLEPGCIGRPATL